MFNNSISHKPSRSSSSLVHEENVRDDRMTMRAASPTPTGIQLPVSGPAAATSIPRSTGVGEGRRRNSITLEGGQRPAASASRQKSQEATHAMRFRTIQAPEKLIGRAQPDSDELISFDVDYCLPRAELKENERLIQLCKEHGLDLHDEGVMKERLQQVLFPERRKPEYLVNPLNHEQYKRDFEAAVDQLSDAQCRAIAKWTDVDNSYTADLNDALSTFAKTGVQCAIPDPEDASERQKLDIHDEVRRLEQSLALLPGCNTLTLRMAHVTEPEHCKVYSDRIKPGTLVSNYPRFMSASTRLITNGDLMDAFDGKPGQVVLISELHGFSGKPLGELNPANDIEEEVLFGPQSVFVLVGTAKAVPGSNCHSTRIAAIYMEVHNQNPHSVQNLHTGELPRFFPPQNSKDMD